MRVCKYLLLAAWMTIGGAAMAQPPDQPEEQPISVRVLKPDGTPLSKGLVSVVNLWRADGSGGQNSVNDAKPEKLVPQTDEDGVYVHGQLTAKSGVHSLYVRAPGVGVGIVPSVMIDHQKPQRIEVRLEPEGSLRVTARDSKGVGLGGARLFLVPADADDLVDEGHRDDPYALNWLLPVDEVNRVTRDGDGTFEMGGLRPGAYFATLLLPGSRAASGHAVETIKVEAGKTTELALELEPAAGFALRLLIQNAAGEPLANREVRIKLQPGPGWRNEPLSSRVATASLSTMKAATMVSIGNNGRRRAVTDKDGRLTLYPVLPGLWQVSLYDHTMEPVVAQVGAQGGQATLRPLQDLTLNFDWLSPAAIVEPK